MTPITAFRRSIAPAALLVALAAPTLVAAQQPAPDAMAGRRRSPEERVQHRLARMTERLGLSADQQARIRRILTEHVQRRQAMRQQQSAPTPEQRRARMTARFEMHDQIEAVLTPQQRAQMRQLHRERMIERAEHGRGGRGGFRGHGRGGRGGRGGRHRQLPPGAV